MNQGALPGTVYTQSTVMEPKQTPGATGIRKQDGQLPVKGWKGLQASPEGGLTFQMKGNASAEFR